MILRQNHFSLLQTAVESQRIKDQNIRFHCADGDFVAKSTHFKIYSKYLYSILCDLHSAECAEFSVILPDVPMSHVSQLNNILINGSSNFDTNKVTIIINFSLHNHNKNFLLNLFFCFSWPMLILSLM